MSGGEVVLEPFSRLTRKVETALKAEAADVVRFLEAPSRPVRRDAAS